MLQRKAEDMAQFLRAGVPINSYKQNRVQVKMDVQVAPVIRGSTKAAIAPHLEDLGVARQELHHAITESVPDDKMRATGRLLCKAELPTTREVRPSLNAYFGQDQCGCPTSGYKPCDAR